MKIGQIAEKHLHDNFVFHGKYSKQGTKCTRKIWVKENGGSFGLDRKSLGSDTDTKPDLSFGC